MKFLKTIIIILIATTLFFSCKKQAGPGGLASIKGRVYGTDVTSSGTVRDSGYLGNQHVFISVAGDKYFFDDIKSSYDGTFEFKFLRKGSYDVWTYSNCDTCLWKQKLVLIPNVEISGRKETVDVGVVKIIF